MKQGIKGAEVMAPKRWNPLNWAVVLCAPIVKSAAGAVCGAVWGLLTGYEEGLETARERLRKTIYGRL